MDSIGMHHARSLQAISRSVFIMAAGREWVLGMIASNPHHVWFELEL